MIKIGIMGTGWIVEKAHILAFNKLEDVIVKSIYDIDLERLNYIKNKFKIPNIYINYDDFLSSDIDAIVIATPNYTHTEYTNIALSNGKHVLCEKPVALSALDYNKSIKLAEKYGKIILPAFVNRFRSEIIKLKDLLTKYDLGALHKINAGWKRNAGVPRPGSWITNKTYSGGGVLVDLGPHVFDICFMAISDKRIEKATLDHIESKIKVEKAKWCQYDCHKTLPVNVETSVSGLVKFKEGTELNFNLSWDCEIKGDTTYFEFIYEKGRITVDTLFGFGTNPLYNTIHINLESESVKEDYEMPLVISHTENAFEYQASHFIKAITHNKVNDLDPLDGLYVTELIESLYASREMSL